MNASTQPSRSLWMETPLRDAPGLDGSLRADVIVIGAGIAGLSTAYELSRAGKSVIVVDRDALGGGMSARTTAHLSSAIDDGFDTYARLRGRLEARAYFDSQSAGVSRIEAIQTEEKIDCDFARVDGYLMLAEGQDRAVLQRELAACHSIGFLDVSFATPPKVEGLDDRPALRFPNQARIHPLKYLDGLAGAIEAKGGKLYGHSAVVDVREAKGEVTVTTVGGHVLRGAAAVVATQAPITGRFVLHTKQAPWRTYAFAAPIPEGAAVDALYWDTAKPYHYVRLQPRAEGGFWLIVGGEDHKSGLKTDADARFDRLEAWARDRFPAMGAIAYRWSGQVLEPVDRAPFIGRMPGMKSIYVATGDSGEGMTGGAVAGMLISDLVLGKPNGWEPTYSPKRKTLRALAPLVAENARFAANLTEHLRGGEAKNYDAIAPGEGAIVREGLKKVAAYRDPSGTLHLRSAVCPHSSCIVHWNAFECCWDCPCHGSQFSIDGLVLKGPATAPLPAHRGK